MHPEAEKLLHTVQQGLILRPAGNLQPADARFCRDSQQLHTIPHGWSVFILQGTVQRNHRIGGLQLYPKNILKKQKPFVFPVFCRKNNPLKSDSSWWNGSCPFELPTDLLPAPPCPSVQCCMCASSLLSPAFCNYYYSTFMELVKRFI